MEILCNEKQTFIEGVDEDVIEEMKRIVSLKTKTTANPHNRMVLCHECPGQRLVSYTNEQESPSK